jgi:ABC-2 type transport system permease protein
MKKIKMPDLKLSPADFRASVKTRTFRVGGYSVLAFVIVLCIAVMANVLVSALPETATQIDVSSSKLFTISDQTETLAEGLKSEVDIYWIVQSGQEDSTIGKLLDRYKSLSDMIKVTEKDPDVYPTFIQQYVSLDEVYNNSLVVVCGDRSSYVSYYDIYETDYSDYYTTGTTTTQFAGESEITSAIQNVTSSSQPKIYMLTGHGESELSSAFQTAVSKANFQTASLSLLTEGKVPDDADCLFICAPQSDISSDEKDMLAEYLKAGGSMMLITDVSKSGVSFTNLYALMEYYGVSAVNGVVVEGSQDNYVYSRPYYLLPNLGDHDITEPLTENGYSVLLPIAQGLKVGSSLRDGLSVTELLTTSDSAYSKAGGYSITTYDKESGDTDGPFALSVAVTDAVDDDTTTSIVWVSSSYLLDDQTNSQVSGGNQDFFENALSWLCHQEDTISIHAKSIGTSYLTVDSSAAALMTAFIVGVIPLGCLGTGIVIWVRRKRR